MSGGEISSGPGDLPGVRGREAGDELTILTDTVGDVALFAPAGIAR